MPKSRANIVTDTVSHLGGSLDDLPIATLLLSADRRCTAANAEARRLLAPIEPLGLRLSALFAAWPSMPDLRRRGAMADSAGLATHNDGRRFACATGDLSGGGLSLCLMDVSAPMQDSQHASRDHLTGLTQRAAFKARLGEIIADPAAHPGAVHYIDLDRFKAVNDTLGHAVGDALLVKVADRLRGVTDVGDVVARFGGDEFAILQTSAPSSDDAQALAARVVDLLGRAFVVQGHTLHIGASVGIALFPRDGEEADTLLRHADLALYRAKADGRAACRFFEPAMNARMQARRLLEADLRRALAFRQFELCFQPLVQLASDKVSGFEALLRWRHPERGLVSPAEFIPLAEEIGLIVPIGEWVLRTACQEAASWPVPATIAVNISPLQFKTGKLAQTVAATLAQSGIAAERLELEITEGALLDETNLVVSSLHAIRALGVRISMDDFGTGYSSLSYLRKFPFDKIKIDQSFVRGLGDGADCDAIVRAVARLGASLGMRTTAEGVETPAQLARIRAEGCTEVQGYLTGRPMSAANVSSLLATQHGESIGPGTLSSRLSQP